MRGKSIISRLNFVVIVVCVMVVLNKLDAKAGIKDILLKTTGMAAGFVEDNKEQEDGLEGVLNLYLPATGYVNTNYIDTAITSNPGSEVEYINLGNVDEHDQSGAGEDATDMVQDDENQGQVEKDSMETAAPVYLKSQLVDFPSLLSNFYTVASITELKQDKFNVAQGLETDFTITQDNSAPQILIFHTHSQEGFVDSVEGDPNTSIVAVGDRLAKILSEEYGYNVIHDVTVYDYVGGVLDRSKAYTYAESGVETILAKYPSIEVILDVHRDGVSEGTHLVSMVNGKDTARIMLFNGISYTKVNGEISYLNNQYIQDNLGMSLQMQLLGNTYYPGLLRKIYINGYRYCLHFRPKSMLIEVGAQTNTLEEELNAMEPLADMLNRLLTGEKAYN